jgi:hypothetical protein
MADKKVTQLSSITRLSGDDLLYVVNNPGTTPASTKITIDNVFANVSSDVSVTGTLDAKANTTITGTTLTITANTTVKGTNLLDAINDRMQVANVQARYASIEYTEQYLQVANTTQFLVNSTSEATFVTVSTPDCTISNGHGFRVDAGGIGDMVPPTSNAATEGINAGTIWFSNTYLYIATDENTIKRVALSTF